ncbi:hypothetical protein B0H13DRAFT_2343954 [Mycena leptocephala]|nr:hypothetical protein B0H13DRAFT_2343954 [Mycena leptocephala]
MSHRTTETEPLLAPRELNANEDDSPNLKLLKFLPVVVLASICVPWNIYVFRICLSQSPISASCPVWISDSPSRQFDIWLQIPGVTLKMDMWAAAVTLLISFASVGWWSSFGDRRGRKYVLLIAVLGAMLRDSIYLAVAQTKFQDDGVSIALIVNGILGGFATFNGVAYATVKFGVLQAVWFISFRLGAFLGLVADPAHSNAGYGGSVFLACFNMAYIFVVLPESFTPPSDQEHAQLFRQESALKYIVSPVTVFLRRGPWRKRLAFLALSTFMYALTLSLDVKMEFFTLNHGYFPDLPRALLSIIPSLLRSLTWLCILPVIAASLKRAHGDIGRLAKLVAQQSILLASLCVLGILIFGGPRSSLPYAVCFFLYPFSAGALPALYSLAASYFTGLGRGSELGLVFGALSMWVALGEYLSYFILGYYTVSDSVWNLTVELGWAATFLVLTLLLLIPADGPPARLVGVTVNEVGEHVVSHRLPQV